MTEKQVPPHITLTMFESKLSEESLIAALDSVLCETVQGSLTWVSVGSFSSKTLFLAPVLSAYLQGLLEQVCIALQNCENTKIQECYKPFAWFPHTTVARRLSEEQMREAFPALQNVFSPFDGTVVRIGLSTGSPKRELATWDLLSGKGGNET